MGRSQIKYRSTHGRGRGRGRGADERNGPDKSFEKWQPPHLRNIGSNAYRYEENDEVEEQDNGHEVAQVGRTQFFASEQKYRESMGPAAGEYYQSRVMKQWEKTDDDAGDAVLDLDWIASQLELVPPHIRYRIDPKYCTDIPYRPQDENDDGIELGAATQRPSSSIHTVTTSTAPSKPPPRDEELDFLLNLSVSTSSQAKPTSSAAPSTAPSIPTDIETETEKLEEWLDDVRSTKSVWICDKVVCSATGNTLPAVAKQRDSTENA